MALTPVPPAAFLCAPYSNGACGVFAAVCLHSRRVFTHARVLWSHRSWTRVCGRRPVHSLSVPGMRPRELGASGRKERRQHLHQTRFDPLRRQPPPRARRPPLPRVLTRGSLGSGREQLVDFVDWCASPTVFSIVTPSDSPRPRGVERDYRPPPISSLSAGVGCTPPISSSPSGVGCTPPISS